MPTAICPRYAFGRRMRVTKLDGCGRPVAGAKNSVVTTGFTAVDISPNVLTGDEVTVKNAGGDLCISDKALDTIKWLTVKITLCTQDPDLIKLLNPTWYEEVDEAGNPIGFRVDTTTTYASGFALELWQDVTGVDVCANINAQGSYGYLLLPFCQGGTLGDISITNKEALTIFNGRTLPNPKWGLGPYNIRQDPSGTPQPLLAPVAATQPLVWFVTSLAPPNAVCGGIPAPAMQLPAPAAPTQVGSGTLSTVTAQWAAVSGAQSYTVSAVKTSTTNPVFSTTVPATALQGTVTGLTAGQTYVVTVTANGDGVNTLTSPASAPTTMATAAANPLSTPTGLTIASPSGATPSATWTAVANVSAPYYVAQVTTAVGGTLVATGTLSGLPATPTAAFTGLTVGVNYILNVVAKGDNLVWGDSPAATHAFTG